MWNSKHYHPPTVLRGGFLQKCKVHQTFIFTYLGLSLYFTRLLIDSWPRSWTDTNQKLHCEILHTMHTLEILHIVRYAHCTLPTVYCTMHNTNCTFTLHTTHNAIQSTQSRMHIANFTLHIYWSLLHPVQCAEYANYMGILQPGPLPDWLCCCRARVTSGESAWTDILH